MSHIEQQIDEILTHHAACQSEGDAPGGQYTVIVRMQPEPAELDQMVRLANQGLIRDYMVHSARELLPSAPQQATKSPTRQLSVGQSGAHELVMGHSEALVEKQRFKPSGAALGALRDRLETSHCYDPDKLPTSNRFLPSAGSAILTIDRDTLASLPDTVKGISDILPNTKLSIPPVQEVDPYSLPQNVRDNKASSWGVNAIGAMAAWGAYNARGQGVKVAVLDTGIDPDHPALAGRIHPDNWAEFDSYGNEVAGSLPYDSAEHGTHCAGTIAGNNASGQWIGVAPEATLVGGLVLPGGTGTTAQVLAGLQWAIDQEVDVISISLGALQMSPEVQDIYTQFIIGANLQGISVVAAIGNDGSQTTGSPGNDVFAFSVGATDSADLIAGFSGGRTQIISSSRFINPENLPYTYSKPDVSAPGVGITSCVPGGGYKTWNGTSMATPHVAGAIALLLSGSNIKNASPEQRAFDIQKIIQGSVEELGESGKDHRFGQGRIDVLRAISMAKDTWG